MPWGPNSSRKYSWKDSAGGGRSRNERERSWRKTDVKSSKNRDQTFLSRLRERGVFRNVGSACAAVFGIVLIVSLMRMPGCTETEILVVTFPGNVEGIAPPKQFAQNDAAAFDQFQTASNYSVQHPNWEELEGTLKNIDQDKVLVLFISAHGVTGAFEDTYLLANKADPDEPESYLSLKKLWTTLKKNKNQKKLVLLDICQLRNEWRMGLFDNGVLDRIESGIRGVPNLVVISSCSPGEKSWAGNDMPGGYGQSVFGHYVVQGLRGHADANKNGELTLEELNEYVKSHTNNWVYQNRDRSGQHPTLFSSVDGREALEWKIASPPRNNSLNSTRTGKQDQKNLAELKQKIRKAWQDREELEKESPFQFDPLGWRILTDRLLEAEDWLDAGNPEGAESILSEVCRGLKRVQRQVQQGRFENFRDKYPFVYGNIVRRIWNDLPQSNGKNADNVTKRPENHLLEDLWPYLPDGTENLARQEAVPIRSQAEEAVSSSLRTLQPVRNIIREADEARRIGEDYLFVPNSEESRKHLEIAKAKYDEAIRIRSILQEAHTLRIQLSAELYDLANWSAQRHPASLSQFRSDVMVRFQQNSPPTSDDLASLNSPKVREGSSDIEENEYRFNNAEVSLLILFNDARKLEELLAKFEDISNSEELGRLENELNALNTLTGKSKTLLESTKAELDGTARKMEKGNPTAQLEYRQQIRDILRCPFLSSQLRSNLRIISENYSRRMAENTHSDSTDSKKALSPGYVKGEWSAFWAIQVLSLGPRNWTVSTAPDRSINFERLQENWRSLRSADASNKKDQLLRLGEEIRKAWKEKGDTVRDSTKLALRLIQQSSSDPDVISHIRAQLSRADRIAGTLHPWDARRLKGTNPTLELHRFLMKELLITHAERYLEDFWAGWYQNTVIECLDAAEETHPAAMTELLKRTKETRALRSQARLEITSSSVGFRRDRKAILSPNVNSRGLLPDGQATIWLALQDNAKAYIQDPINSRTAISTAGDRKPNQFRLKRVMSDSPDPRSLPKRVDATFKIFFRGHLWPGLVKIDPHIPKGSVVTYIPTKHVGEVVMKGIDSRPIVFILDGSGSMIWEINKVGEKTRFSIAKETLLKALEEISEANILNVQRGDGPTKVGLIVFAKTEEDEPTQIRTISDVKPIEDDHITKLAQYNDGTIHEKGGTPLLRSLLRGCALLRDGPGIIVAITDGAFSVEEERRYFHSLQNKLTEQRRGGEVEVDLHIVGFQVSPNSKEAIQLNKLKNDPINANFIFAARRQKLLAELQKATESRKYRIYGPTPLSDDGEPVPLNESYDLNSGHNYQVGFGSKNKNRQIFDIAGGEQIVFQYNSAIGDIVHVKPKLRSQVVAKSPDANENHKWFFGYQKYEVTQQTASFELSVLHDGKQFVPRPEEVHFEIHPLGDLSKRSFTWRILEDQSVPTWKVDVQWPPGAQQAEIEAFWKMGRTEPEIVILPVEAWDDQPDSITFNASDSEARNLTLTSSWKNAEQSATIELQLGDDQLQGGGRRIKLDNFSKARVELARWDKGNWTPEDLSYSSEFIEDKGMGRHDLIFEFKDLPANFDPQDWAILVTSWKSLRNGCYKLQKPLKINKPSNE